MTTQKSVFYETIPKHKFWRLGNWVFRFEQAWRKGINYYERYIETEKFATLICGANIPAGSVKITENEFNAVKRKYLVYQESIRE